MKRQTAVTVYLKNIAQLEKHIAVTAYLKSKQ